MNKAELTLRTDEAFNQTKLAIQTIWDNIVYGQQKQLIKLDEVKAVLDRYGVEINN